MSRLHSCINPAAMLLHRSLCALLFAVSISPTFGTHLIGGEIRYGHISVTTFSVEVVTWCDLSSPADRPEIMVDFGDGVIDTVPRTAIVDDPLGGASCGAIRFNTYATTHTYPGFGTYVIRHTDNNRNGGIINIPNSVAQPFSISALLVIGPASGANNSVQFNAPLTESTWNWSTLIHDPQASDADGDSLSFQLVTPQGLNGSPIVGYVFADQLTSPGGFAWCDPTTGAFLWDHPYILGEYVIAIRCDEWRDGVLVGQVTRDMTICVSTVPTSTPDAPPAPEDVHVLRVNEDWVLENKTEGTLRGELINANGAVVHTLNLASGRTVIPLSYTKSLVLLNTTDAEGIQRTFKLAP